MAENKKRSKLRRLIRAVLGGALSLLAMAAIYLAAVLLQPAKEEAADRYVVVDDPVPITRMQSGAMNDARGLAQLFGAPLPMLPGYTPAGEGGNAVHDGENVRVAALRYEGLTVTAVQPAAAAPMLLRQELSVSLRSDVTVLGLPAVLARREDALCVYFTGEFASYSIYAPSAQEAEFFSILDRLAWAM